MVQLSGLAAHKKPRIWAWQPPKSLDYTVFILNFGWILNWFFGLFNHLLSPAFLKPAWFATLRWQTFILNRSFLNPTWRWFPVNSPDHLAWIITQHDLIYDIRKWWRYKYFRFGFFTLIAIQVGLPTRQGSCATGMYKFILLWFDYQSGIFWALWPVQR